MPAQYNVLLVGETGSGKSTIINYVTNYFYKGTLAKLRVAIANWWYVTTEKWRLESNERDSGDRTKSKTQKPSMYEFNKDGYNINFIDTPGLSDTNGATKDDEHIAAITQYAETTGTLAAIVLVINGTVVRDTGSMRNTLARLRDAVPDVLLKHLIVVFTMCSTFENFDIKTLKPWDVSKESIFTMENSAFSQSEETWANANDRQKRNRQRDWDDSMETIGDLIKRVIELGYSATSAFGEIRRKKDEIKSRMQTCLLEVSKIQALQDSLGSNQITADKKKKIEYIEMVEDTEYNTLCLLHPTIICHKGCSIDYTPKKGDYVFNGCLCMEKVLKAGFWAFIFRQKEILCKECGCSYGQHYHSKLKPVGKTRTVSEILDEVKAEFEKNGNEGGKKIPDLGADVEAAILTKVLDLKEEKIVQLCEELKDLCSAYNFKNEFNSAIENLEVNANNITSNQIKAQALERVGRIRALVRRLTT